MDRAEIVVEGKRIPVNHDLDLRGEGLDTAFNDTMSALCARVKHGSRPNPEDPLYLGLKWLRESAYRKAHDITLQTVWAPLWVLEMFPAA